MMQHGRPRRFSPSRVIDLTRVSCLCVMTPGQTPEVPEANQGSGAEQLCVCGHPKNCHQHYRAGTDCSLCPPGVCDRFRRRHRRGRRQASRAPGPEASMGRRRRSTGDLAIAPASATRLSPRPAARTQISPRALTASRSSANSATEASILPREKSSMSSPWTISHEPPLDVTGNPEMRPSGTP